MKIAVCDDDRLLTGEIDGQLQKIREKTGISFETDIFFDGETLWKAIEQNGSYDVVYLDIEMKNMDGITVARKIRERDPYAILIFISSYDSYYEQLFEVEPLRFLHKPIDPEKFDEYFRVAYTKLTSLEDRLHFEFNKRLYQIPYRDIVYMESRRRVIHLFGRNGEEYRFYKKNEGSPGRNQPYRKYVYPCTLFLCGELLLHQIPQLHRGRTPDRRKTSGERGI